MAIYVILQFNLVSERFCAMFTGERPLSLMNSPDVFVQRPLFSELLLAVGTDLWLNIAV